MFPFYFLTDTPTTPRSGDKVKCLCQHCSQNISTTANSTLIEKKIEQLKKDLKIVRNTTSVYLRRLTSIPDKRTSSAVIGSSMIGVVCCFFAIIIALDINHWVNDIKQWGLQT